MMVDPSGFLAIPNWLKVTGTVVIVGGLIAAAVIVGGPVLIGAAIGAAVGTAIGAGVGYAVNGKQGAIDGALIGAVGGAVIGATAGAAYSVTQSFLATTQVVDKPGIVIGQTMTRVLAEAERLGMGTYAGLKFYGTLAKISPRLANAVGWLNNKMWLANNVNAGKDVYSIGYDSSRPPTDGSFYKEIAYLIKKGIEYIVQRQT